MPREDLNKLLCERQRIGSSMSFKDVRHAKRFADHEHTREGMKHRYGYDTKTLNENLTPLWGYIRKSVNRPWDLVYSDLVKVFEQPHICSFAHREDDVNQQLHREIRSNRPNILAVF